MNQRECQKCGLLMNIWEKACSNCGTPAGAAPLPDPEQPGTPAPAQRRALSLLNIVLALMLLAVVGGVAREYKRSHDPKVVAQKKKAKASAAGKAKAGKAKAGKASAAKSTKKAGVKVISGKEAFPGGVSTAPKRRWWQLKPPPAKPVAAKKKPG